MYLGLSLALIMGSGVLGARLLGLRSFWDRFLAAVLIALAKVVLLSLGIGLFPGGYRPLPLLLGAAALFLVLLMAALWTGRIVAPPMEQEEATYLWTLYAVIGLTLPIWLWILFNGLLLPPVYWDELYYHLVAPGIWARDAQIHFFGPTMGNPFVAGYPANLNMVWGWTMVMTGTDVWADLAGLPFVVIGLAVLLAFARKLGVEARHAFWAGLLFVTTPMVILHAKASYIDLPMSVLFAIASYFLYLYATGGARVHLMLGGVAMGLMVGAKYSGPYLAIAGLVPIFYYLKTAWIKRQTWISALFLYGVPVVLLGAFWYIKNLIIYGNPLHPMRLTVGGVALFGGFYDSDAFNFTKPENNWVTLFKAMLDLEWYPQMDSYYSGLGPQLLLLAVPATLLFLVKERRGRWLYVITWLIPLFLSVASLPARYPRYLLHLNLFLLPFAAWLLQDMGRWSRRVVQLVMVSFAAYSVLIATPIYFVHVSNYRVAARTVWAAHLIGVGAQDAVVQTLNDELNRPVRILTGTTRLTYPLLGERWQNQLLHVEPTDEESWLLRVKETKADLLWVDGAVDTSVEAKWAEKHPEHFEPYYSDGIVYVFRIRQGEEGAP